MNYFHRIRLFSIRLSSIQLSRRFGCYPAVIALLLTAIATSLTSCTFASTAGDIRQHPRRNWFNSTVYLQGTVGDRVPLLSGQVYQLKDDTGEVWVLSDHKTLTSGAKVRIKGRVYLEKIEAEGMDLSEAYVRELEVSPVEEK
jgi:hypothetical protein